MRAPIAIRTMLAAAVTGPAAANEAGADAFSGTRITLFTGFDATELPHDDGPETMAALEVGHDRAFGRWIVGGAGSLGTTTADKTERDFVAPGDQIRVRYGRDLYGGVRVGHTLGSRFLAYGRAGLALTRMRAEYTANAAAGTVPQVPDPLLIPKFSRPGTLLGFWTGGGLEYALGRDLFALTEYRYSNFHDGIYRHQAIVGVGVRF